MAPDSWHDTTGGPFGAADDWQDGPLHDLLLMLLTRLAGEIGTEQAGIEVTAPDGSPEWQLGVPAGGSAPGTVVRGTLDDGRTLHLSTGADSAAAGQRYLRPILTLVNLGLHLRAQRMQARTAIETVEAATTLDLATGVLMGRRGINAAAARDTLERWSTRTGISIRDLSPASMLEFLDDDQPFLDDDQPFLDDDQRR